MCRSLNSNRPFRPFSCLQNCQCLKCHWTQRNAVPAPMIAEIQRSHTSHFIKTLTGRQPPAAKPKGDVSLQFPHLWFSTLTTENCLHAYVYCKSQSHCVLKLSLSIVHTDISEAMVKFLRKVNSYRESGSSVPTPTSKVGGWQNLCPVIRALLFSPSVNAKILSWESHLKSRMFWRE